MKNYKIIGLVFVKIFFFSTFADSKFDYDGDLSKDASSNNFLRNKIVEKDLFFLLNSFGLFLNKLFKNNENDDFEKNFNNGIERFIYIFSKLKTLGEIELTFSHNHVKDAIYKAKDNNNKINLKILIDNIFSYSWIASEVINILNSENTNIFYFLSKTLLKISEVKEENKLYFFNKIEFEMKSKFELNPNDEKIKQALKIVQFHLEFENFKNSQTKSPIKNFLQIMNLREMFEVQEISILSIIKPFIEMINYVQIEDDYELKYVSNMLAYIFDYKNEKKLDVKVKFEISCDEIFESLKNSKINNNYDETLFIKNLFKEDYIFKEIETILMQNNSLKLTQILKEIQNDLDLMKSIFKISEFKHKKMNSLDLSIYVLTKKLEEPTISNEVLPAELQLILQEFLDNRIFMEKILEDLLSIKENTSYFCC